MEEDIEKRLRAWIGGKWPRNQSMDDDIIDAATEICRLRSHIRMIRVGIDPYDGNPPKWVTTVNY